MATQKSRLIITIFIFTAGIVFGSLFAVKTPQDRLYSYFAELAKGYAPYPIKYGVLVALAVWLLLFFSAYFKFGTLSAGSIILARGFFDGFCITAILSVLGIRGVGLFLLDFFDSCCCILMVCAVFSALKDSEYSGGKFLAQRLILLPAMLVCATLDGLLAKPLVGLALKGFGV